MGGDRRSRESSRGAQRHNHSQNSNVIGRASCAEDEECFVAEEEPIGDLGGLSLMFVSEDSTPPPYVTDGAVGGVKDGHVMSESLSLHSGASAAPRSPSVTPSAVRPSSNSSIVNNNNNKNGNKSGLVVPSERHRMPPSSNSIVGRGGGGDG